MLNNHALAEAEWDVCLTEFRVIRAIRLRAHNDNDVDDAHVSGLFTDLRAAIARFRAAKKVAPSAKGR